MGLALVCCGSGGGCGVGLAAIRRGFEVWAWNWFMVVFVKVCGGFGHRFVAVGS